MINSDLLIRRAKQCDAKAIMALIQRAMIVYVKKSGIPGTLDSLSESIEDIKLSIENNYVLVAENKDDLIGTVRLILPNENNIQCQSQVAYFSRFAVKPELQHSGTGSILFAAAEDYLRNSGIKTIRLHTALKNSTLVQFYQTKGFRLISQENSRGYDRGCFEKDIK